MHEVDERYPFDLALEGLEVHYRGLKKLRCYRDRVMAARLYDIGESIAAVERARERPAQRAVEDDSDTRFP